MKRVRLSLLSSMNWSQTAANNALTIKTTRQSERRVPPFRAVQINMSFRISEISLHFGSSDDVSAKTTRPSKDGLFCVVQIPFQNNAPVAKTASQMPIKRDHRRTKSSFCFKKAIILQTSTPFSDTKSNWWLQRFTDYMVEVV